MQRVFFRQEWWLIVSNVSSTEMEQVGIFGYRVKRRQRVRRSFEVFRIVYRDAQMCCNRKWCSCADEPNGEIFYDQHLWIDASDRVNLFRIKRGYLESVQSILRRLFSLEDDSEREGAGCRIEDEKMVGESDEETEGFQHLKWVNCFAERKIGKRLVFSGWFFWLMSEDTVIATKCSIRFADCTGLNAGMQAPWECFTIVWERIADNWIIIDSARRGFDGRCLCKTQFAMAMDLCFRIRNGFTALCQMLG